MKTSSKSVLDLILSEVSKQKEQKQGTGGAPVTNGVATQNIGKNSVASDSRVKVASGLHHLESLELFTPQANLCIGKLCDHFRRGDEDTCGVNGQTIATIFLETGRCPENRWRRLQLPAMTHERSTRCSICGHDRWWRPHGQTRLICSICHPPVLPKSQYKILTTKES